ncbi:MAG: hypothetical protein HYV07_06815 [Deltaproteobacteria bacterium]|nr:hypothetical protein [Deltaproteobacteria bacterium]
MTSERPVDSVDAERASVELPLEKQAPPVASNGVDLTQSRALRRMTPTERARALVVAANNLLRIKHGARRV